MAKIPPPPPIASMDPAFNRWLLEVTAILNPGGEIDPGTVEGLPATQAQVAQNTTKIGTLQGQVATANINIASLNARVTAAEGNITTLQARNQVYSGASDPGAGLGVNGDWYARTDAPNRAVWVKSGGSWARVTALL